MSWKGMNIKTKIRIMYRIDFGGYAICGDVDEAAKGEIARRVSEQIEKQDIYLQNRALESRQIVEIGSEHKVKRIIIEILNDFPELVFDGMVIRTTTTNWTEF